MNILKKVNVGKIVSLIINTIVVIALFLMFKAASHANISLMLYIKCLGFIIFVGILKILTNNKKVAILIDILVCILTIGFILYLFKDLVTLAIEPVLAGKYSILEFENFFDPIFSQKTTDYIDIIIVAPFVLVLSLFFRNFFIKNNGIIIYLASMLGIMFYIYFEQHIVYTFFAIIFFLLIFKLYLYGLDKNLRFNLKQFVFVLATFIIAISLAVSFRYLIEMFSKPAHVLTMADFEVFKYAQYVKKEDAEDYHRAEDKTFYYLFDPKLGEITNNSFFPTNEKVFKYESTYDVDCFVAYKFYDYDEETHTFLVEHDESREQEVLIPNIRIAKNLNKTYFDKSIKQTDEISEDLTETIKVINTGENNFVYYPYGDFHITYDGELITSYLDRGIVTSYTSAFEDTEYTIYLNNEAIFNESFLPYFTKDEESSTPYFKTSNYEYVITYAYHQYLKVPESFKDVLTQFLLDNNIDPNNADKLQIINQIKELLNSNYKYSNNLSLFPSDEDPILTFLFKTKKGYSNHFAAAETMLYRICGIPARYVCGYRTNGTSGDVRAKDGYAWCEVFYGTNWFPSDNVKEIVYESKDYILDLVYEEKNMNQWGRPLYDIYITEEIDLLKEDSTNDDIVSARDYGINDLSKYYYELTTSDDTEDYFVAYKRGVGLFPNAVLSKFGGSYHDDSYIYHLVYSNNKNETKLGFDLDKKVAVDEKYSEYVYDNYLHVDTITLLQLEEWFKEYGIDRFSENKEELIKQIQAVYYNYYTYTLNTYTYYPGKNNQVQFLMDIKAGLCKDYAAASVLLFRMCGIPTRLVTGYLGCFPANRRFTLYEGSAHAWVETYSKENGWETVEVTTAMADKPYNFPNYGSQAEKPIFMQGDEAEENSIKYKKMISEKGGSEQEGPPINDSPSEDVLETDDESNVPKTSNPIDNKKSLNISSILKYLLYFLLVLVLIALSFVFCKPFKRFINKNKPTISQRINIYYQLLVINNFVENDIHFMMERLKYSLDTENKEDLTMIKNSYIKLNSNLKKEKKLLVLVRNGITHGLLWTKYLFANIFKINKHKEL